MAENSKKTVLTVKQQLELPEKFENGGWATQLAKEYGGRDWVIASIKQHYRADLRTVANEDSIIG
jgi:hypothetical protein